MSQKSKTPAGTGASHDSFAGLSLPYSSPLTTQAQFLRAAHHVRPELIELLPMLVFGEGVHHG